LIIIDKKQEILTVCKSKNTEYLLVLLSYFVGFIIVVSLSKPFSVYDKRKFLEFL
jgi:hypothetical protein